MRKIAVKKWIPTRYHREHGEIHLIHGTSEWSKTEIEYIGYFHQWAILDNKIYAIIELEDGNVFRFESASVKFIDKC